MRCVVVSSPWHPLRLGIRPRLGGRWEVSVIHGSEGNDQFPESIVNILDSKPFVPKHFNLMFTLTRLDVSIERLL